MKRSISYLLYCIAFASLLILSGCEKEKPTGGDEGGDEGGEEQVIDPSSETLGSENVTTFSALLKGKADLGSSSAKDAVMGIMWSEKSDFPASGTSKANADKPDKNNNYSIEASALTPGTKYYYRSFLTVKGKDYFGEANEFTTKEISTIFGTLPSSDITATGANMNAKLDLSGIKYSSLEYGFYWGTSEESQEKYLKGGSVADGKYSITLKDLQHKTQYWYRAWMKLDGKTYDGALESFTTGAVSVENVTLDKNEISFHNIGDAVTLKATVYPSDATDKGIKWTTSDENVAAVDDDGNVSAVGNGTATITVTADENGKSASCSVTVSQWVQEITLDKESVTLEAGESATLTATVGPDDAADKTLSWSSSDPSVATVDGNGLVSAVSKGKTTITVSANDGSDISASCEVNVFSYIVPGTVDLGLSVKWATFNVGASSPEDSGMYFAWGETETKADFTWPTYSLCYGTNNTLTKYNVRSSSGIVDGKTVLESEDDVARAKLGGKFRTPTREEFADLANPENCSWTWTEINGVKGYKVTSKIEGFEGNWIFLPASGHYDGNNLSKEGTVGFYWSASINADSPKYSYCLEFSSGDYYWYNSNRCEGLSVRPVTD